MYFLYYISTTNCASHDILAFYIPECVVSNSVLGLLYCLSVT